MTCSDAAARDEANRFRGGGSIHDGTHGLGDIVIKATKSNTEIVEHVIAATQVLGRLDSMAVEKKRNGSVGRPPRARRRRLALELRRISFRVKGS
jgi:hypothetical protein